MRRISAPGDRRYLDPGRLLGAAFLVSLLSFTPGPPASAAEPDLFTPV